MTYTELSKELLSDRIYDVLRASILNGSRGPGTRLVESEIARGMTVSQAPVREALKRLVHEGLVTSAPRRGSYVTQVSQSEFALARQLRAAVESVGARSAVAGLTEADLADLRGVVARMGAAVTVGDWAEFRSLDAEFHARVLVIGDHAVLSRVWAVLEPLLMSQRAIGDPAYPGDRFTVVQWHDDLVNTLAAGDPEAAAAAFFAHASGALGVAPAAGR
ncbi:GntR family transcriptional regulator [Kutzneria sp. CA-103260]|uniref:GntR family transcriptional regulator n=1 Tax=Kutzneria sp. CA-103260 TaxID=2802641 RepID=UPI001BA4D3C3|nr:GntR family transcriptional regulator [Kutzneria sp. CA-103260]QUQ72470.1 GntR family transcriptional regulator [Kutzneria sp. CA-103260]